MYVLNNTLYMPYADRYIKIDGIEVPTGGIGVTNGTNLDFTKPGKTIGQDIASTLGVCGTGCTGYDNAFILDRPRYSAPDDPSVEVLRMWAPSTGIQMSLETNQQSLQIYSCNGQNGTIPVKSDQQHLGKTTYVEKYGCIVIETQDVSALPCPLIIHVLILTSTIVDRRHQPASMGPPTMADLLTDV